MALGSAITNAVNKVKSSLGLSSVNNTGNINTSTSQTAGTPANAIGSGGAKQVVNAQKKQDDAYNTWANEQVIAGLRNNTYIGGSAVAAGNMYGSNKNFAGNVITNKDLTNSSNQKAIDKMNRFNQRVGRNETFAVVDGKTTPLTQRTVYVIDGVTGMKPPTSLKGLNSTSYSIFTTPGGSVVTQKSDGNLTASSNIPNSPQLSGVARYGRNDGNTLQGFISESPIGNTNIAQTAVRYLTGNQGEFGYTNKDYDTIYQNKDGTKWGGVKEAGTTLFNIGREAASGLATAGRYHLDKEAQGIVQNYVLGESQRETFDRNAAAHIREAYEGSSTVIHKNEKTGKEYIYVKNVKVPISVAERASADVYGGNAQFLGIKENGGDAYNWTNQWINNRKMDVETIKEVASPITQAVSPITGGIKKGIGFADNAMAETYSLYSPFRSGAIDGTKALVAFPGMVVRTGAKSLDMVVASGGNREKLGTLYGAAISEFDTKLVNPIAVGLQESDYTPSQIAYFVGGFVPDYATGRLGGLAKNRVILPGRLHATNAIDNIKIVDANYIRPLRSEADVASHASKMLGKGTKMDFETVQARLPGVYTLTDSGTYRVQYAKVKKHNINSLVAGDNISGSRIEQKLLGILKDPKLNKFGSTEQTGNYLQRNWGNPTKFLQENQPRRLRNLFAEKVDNLKADPVDLYSSSRSVGLSPLDAVEESMKQINANRRIDKISGIIGESPTKQAVSAVKLAAKKKKYVDANRQRYGDYVSRTSVEDVAKYTKMSSVEAESLLKGFGITDSFEGKANPIVGIPRKMESKNVYGVHASSESLGKQVTSAVRGRAESPVLYVGMDSMAATAFLGVDHRIGILPRLPNMKVPSIGTYVIPAEKVAKLDTKIMTKSGKETTIRKSFDTKSENVYIGRDGRDSKVIFEQFADWNDDVIPAAKREGYVASQLPKYGENKSRNLIEHEMGIYDQTEFIRNPFAKGYTFYKGHYIDTPQYIFRGNPIAGVPAPDYAALPKSGDAKRYEDKIKRAIDRDEYVLREETRKNKITRKENPLIPVSRAITDKEFKRLTRPGFTSSAMDIGYDVYSSGKTKLTDLKKKLKKKGTDSPVPSRVDDVVHVDSSFKESLKKRTVVQSGIINPIYQAVKSSRTTAEKKSVSMAVTAKKTLSEKKSLKTSVNKSSKTTSKKTSSKSSSKTSTSSKISSSSSPKISSSRSTSISRGRSKSSIRLPSPIIPVATFDLGDGNKKLKQNRGPKSEKDRTLLGIRKTVDFKKFSI